MATKFEILEQLTNPLSSTYKNLDSSYSDPDILDSKLLKLKNLLNNSALLPNARTVVSRCPGRLSFSKHADYINSDLLYTLDDRDTFVAGQIITDPQHEFFNKLKLDNLSPEFAPALLPRDSHSSDWTFYPLKILEELKPFIPQNAGVILVFASDLPPAGGLSSSHALMISTLITLIELFQIEILLQALADRHQASPAQKKNLKDLLVLLQRVEHARGFKSGLGDQSAEIFGKKNHLSFIKIHPDLELEYHKIPSGTLLVTAPSMIKADKSLPEFQSANQNIQRYKDINLMATGFGCEFLGDLVYKYSQEEIFGILKSIEDPQLRGLALYGLAESARLKNLKQDFSIERLGAHLNLSHQAEIIYKVLDGNWQELSQEEKLFYEFNSSKPLSEHYGIYRASTKQNDILQHLATQVPGVYGSSLSGAGLGGNNIILAGPESKTDLINTLDKNFYQNHGQSALTQLHFSSSSAPAGILTKTSKNT